MLENVKFADLSSDEKSGLLLARGYREGAYAPYSNYKVGACVYSEKPKKAYYSGFNIENASYGLTVCAERVAIFNALLHGSYRAEKMFIVTENGGMSCGACRQVEYEFNPDMVIITANLDFSAVTKVRLSEIYKMGFGPKSLPEHRHKFFEHSENVKRWYGQDFENFESEPE